MAFRQTWSCCAPIVQRSFARSCSTLLIVFLAIASSCTGDLKVVVVSAGLTAGSNTRFAYVANRNDNTLSIFVFDTEYDINGDKGQLRHNGYVETGAEPVSVAADPSGSFVFVANSGDDTVSAYSADPDDGRLTEVAGSPFGTGAAPKSVAVSPSGTFVFAANSGDNTVSAFSVDTATGVLTEVMNSPFATGTNPTSVASSTGDGLIFVANTDDNTVSSFSYDPSVGELSEVSGSPFATGFGPSSITVNSVGSIAYVTNFLSGAVSAFAVSNKGQLGELAASPFMTQSGPFSMTVSSSGRFAYVANFTSNSVTGFAVQNDGSLIEITGSPFAAGVDPLGVAVEVGERSAVVVNSGDHTASEFTIDPISGELFFDRLIRTRLAPASIALGAGTKPMTIAPAFAYVANFSSSDISVFAIDELTGDLTEIANSPVPTASFNLEEELALDPLGEFAYFPSGLSDSMAAFRIENGGGLTELSSLPFGMGSPFAVGNEPRSVSVDPSGRFVYVAVRQDSLIRGFTINRLSGELAPMGMTFPVNFPTDIEVDPTGRFAFVVGDGDLITSFSLDSSTGALTLIGTGSPGTSALLLQIAPSGTHAYVLRQTNAAGGKIAAFNINATTGALTNVAGSPFTSGAAFPFSFVIDPNGNFLYVGDINGGEVILTMGINQGTGAPTALSNSGPVSGNLVGVGIDVTGQFMYAGDNGVSFQELTVDRATGIVTPAGTTVSAGGNGPRGFRTSGTFR